jgi:dihydroflavonol-4-reductase
VKVLITGATGFVGGAVARRLLAAGHTVRALVRPTSDRRNIDGLAVEPVVGDLRTRESLVMALAGQDALFHVAADYRIWAPRPQELLDSNVTGTANIMDAALAAGTSRIVYCSSVAALGYAGRGIAADELTPADVGQMVGTYKRSKFLAEAEVMRRVRENGLPAVIVNPSAPMGPGDIKPTPTGRIIVDAASGRIPAYVETGFNVVHVDDVAEGHLLAFEKGKIGERYILGGENLTLLQTLTIVAELSGRRRPRIKIPHAVTIPIGYCAETWCRVFGGVPMATADAARMAKKMMFYSSDKAKRELGYVSRPAREAIADSLTWFRANGYLV